MNYKVIYITPKSPTELERWLNRMYAISNYKLIAVDNNYYIFELQPDVIVDEKST